MFVFAAIGAPFVASAATAASAIGVTDVWSRPAVGTGVVYLTIHKHGTASDRLIDASSPVAEHVEMHETVSAAHTGAMKMGAPMPGMPAGAMEMRRVRAVSVPAGGKITFKPGGYHIMLIGLRHNLAPGQTIPIRLQFAKAGWIAARSSVRGM
ncbi:MAG: copper chaperone PCu(A)C [Vulcanimicrobiaceae bacterium]